MQKGKNMANEKYTQAQILNAILDACNDGAEFGTVPTDVVAEFCEKKIGQLQNKTSKVNATKVAEREEFFENIKAVIGVGRMTASEILKSYNATYGTDYTLPKITNALTAMGEKGTGEISRVMDKKTAWFSLA